MHADAPLQFDLADSGEVHPFEGKGFVRASVGAAGCKRVEGFVSRGNDVENRVSGQTSYGTSTGSESWAERSESIFQVEIENVAFYIDWKDVIDW